jgi:hypothetical protein
LYVSLRNYCKICEIKNKGNKINATRSMYSSLTTYWMQIEWISDLRFVSQVKLHVAHTIVYSKPSL